jgi:alanine racemase
LKSRGILTINLDAAVRNYRLLQGLAAPGARAGAVVKANGYGLGAAALGEALAAAGCNEFFVASAEEGAALRTVLFNARIFILSGFYDGAAELYAAHNLIPLLGSFPEIEAYKKLSFRQGKKHEAFLSFNTNLNRLGMGARETETLIANPRMLEGINVTGILSHFACADEKDHPMNEAQYKIFDRIAGHFPNAEKTLANSSAIFRDQKYHYDLLRPGMAIYGLNPTPEAVNPMQAVVSLNVPVIRTLNVRRGASVGYGAAWIADKDTVLATVSAGYADGLPRHLGNSGAFYWQGKRCPIRGRVSMDLITVDLSAIPENDHPRAGDYMEVLGPHQSADDLARDAGTIGYEILTALGQRYERQYSKVG